MLGYVGIEAVLDQLKIKAMKMGFEFNIMVVVIEESGVKLKLTVTDTPGFGDQINNNKWWVLAGSWDPILGYISEQYEKYLQEEILITRQRHIPDTRVHCCVYFVPPTGHCLRPLDIEFLQRLCRTVNVVPVIARADSLTIEEREAFRHRIQENLKTHGIEVYPQKCFDEDINDKILNSKIRERIPFAVVGADREHIVNGRCVLGRKTKWGIIEVENMAHCEFPLLRDLLIRSHLQDLKDITHNVHYENYRIFRLNESHVLPRGPGWVNLAPAPASIPAPAGPQASPRPPKVCWWAKDNSDEEC
ncbi:Septin-12, partial [Eschrichtius robustus]|nr:Septin-12 [Eschrichtius robustus]